jgi:hypothetical protein
VSDGVIDVETSLNAKAAIFSSLCSGFSASTGTQIERQDSGHFQRIEKMELMDGDKISRKP